MDDKERSKQKMTDRELITQVFACGAWHKIMKGTLRRVESGPPVLGTDETWTWIIHSESLNRVRFYVKADQIIAVNTEISLPG